MTSPSLPDHTAAPVPAAVRLAPGLRVVRRGRDRLQVGLHPERRLVLPRRPATEQLLDELAGTVPAPVTVGPGNEGLLAGLAERDLLAAVEPRPPARLEVRGSPTGTRWPVDPTPLLDAPVPRLRLVPGAPDAVLLLSLGEPDRELLDPLVRDGVPHLVLALVDGGARLGPLVVPGRTACLRCVDAHLSALDPEHLAVSTRYGAASRVVRDDDVDPALAGLATAWALRDLALLLRPEPVGSTSPPTPSSWSTTLTWHPRSPSPDVRAWLRHPRCGCGWATYDDQVVATDRATVWATDWASGASAALPSGTMGT